MFTMGNKFSLILFYVFYIICRKTLLLKLYQFYSAKNTRRDTHKTRKPLFPQLKTAKYPSCSTDNFLKTEKMIIKE